MGILSTNETLIDMQGSLSEGKRCTLNIRRTGIPPVWEAR